MFGITKLTPEEKAAHDKKKRIAELETLSHKEGVLRDESLKRAKAYQEELTLLTSKK